MVRGIGAVALLSLALARPALSADTVEAVANKARLRWLECLLPLNSDLRAHHVTPERYQMAISGACLAEEEPFKLATKAYFISLGDPRMMAGHFAEFAANAEQQANEFPEHTKKKLISEYTIWYETGGDKSVNEPDRKSSE